MRFSVIICTYMRPQALANLLESIHIQQLYPHEILIIDGSTNTETQDQLAQTKITDLHYFLVDSNQRGLTKQRNFGLSKVSDNIEVVCFLDDDTVLAPDYFEQLLKTYTFQMKANGKPFLKITNPPFTNFILTATKNKTAVALYCANDWAWMPICHRDICRDFPTAVLWVFYRLLAKPMR